MPQDFCPRPHCIRRWQRLLCYPRDGDCSGNKKHDRGDRIEDQGAVRDIGVKARTRLHLSEKQSSSGQAADASQQRHQAEPAGRCAALRDSDPVRQHALISRRRYVGSQLHDGEAGREQQSGVVAARPAWPTSATTMPATISCRRRPKRVFNESETAPATGVTVIAMIAARTKGRSPPTLDSSWRPIRDQPTTRPVRGQRSGEARTTESSVQAKGLRESLGAGRKDGRPPARLLLQFPSASAATVSGSPDKSVITAFAIGGSSFSFCRLTQIRGIPRSWVGLMSWK